MTSAYYRTTITLVVLSGDPLPHAADPADVIRECDSGDYVLASTAYAQEQIGEPEMALALTSAGSDPGFFRIGEGE